MKTNTIYFDSKPRYEILDGLRGVAAVLVLAFHLFETYSKGPVFQIINHGYLAVDFFFMLSGFVIAYAYDDRWNNQMKLWSFFKRRLIRLHPMLIFGTFIGILLFYLGASAVFPKIAVTPWYKVLILGIYCMTILPALPSWDIRGWGETNPLNSPAWSLQWEYIGNILYAILLRRIKKLPLLILIFAAAILTLDLTLGLNLFGLIDTKSWSAHTVIGGWSWEQKQIYIATTRLLFPFMTGLFLSRIGHFIRIKNGFFWCSVFICILLAMPNIGGMNTIHLPNGNEQIIHTWYNGMYEAVTIIVCFPIIVLIGAGSKIKSAVGKKVCTFLGEISYPLYITHYPLIYLHWAWASNHKDAPIEMRIFVGIGVFILSLLVAYASLKLYDIPVREWLKKRLFAKK